jgi:hypothetical protein
LKISHAVVAAIIAAIPSHDLKRRPAGDDGSADHKDIGTDHRIAGLIAKVAGDARDFCEPQFDVEDALSVAKIDSGRGAARRDISRVVDYLKGVIAGPQIGKEKSALIVGQDRQWNGWKPAWSRRRDAYSNRHRRLSNRLARRNVYHLPRNESSPDSGLLRGLRDGWPFLPGWPGPGADGKQGNERGEESLMAHSRE